ncbi:cuticle protein 14 isoform b [Caerostris darwini]|uniref:Cuticle protein 14 isoform b n=1 Tax=Caerostris darwini TaxID=1538125 RepID=A0AAV4S030_9ARAC|nr:cuticle protein 14 isoform b [Caerostris darwini]
MKILLLVALLVVACHAQLPLDTPPMLTTRLGEDGTSSITQYHRDDKQGNYDYGYNEGHNEGGSFRRERGDAYGRKIGTYGYTNNEGLIRIVNYVADENGFRAELKSTEPGVDEKEPASVIVFKEDTPTLMTYPGPEAASVPDANGNVPGLPAASQPQQYVAQPMQYAAQPMQFSASAPYPVAAAAQQNGNVRVNVNGQYGGYSYAY